MSPPRANRSCCSRGRPGRSGRRRAPSRAGRSQRVAVIGGEPVGDRAQHAVLKREGIAAAVVGQVVDLQEEACLIP